MPKRRHSSMCAAAQAQCSQGSLVPRLGTLERSCAGPRPFCGAWACSSPSIAEDGLVAAVLEAPTLGEGLAALREAQEAATMDGLRQRTAEFVSEGTFGLSGC